MSADNWTTCPRCVKRQEATLLKRVKEVADLYGKVPIAEFDAARTELFDLEQQQMDNNLREDWEIGMFEGEFFVKYTGFCSICHLRHEFEYSQQVNLDES